MKGVFLICSLARRRAAIVSPGSRGPERPWWGSSASSMESETFRGSMELGCLRNKIMAVTDWFCLSLPCLSSTHYLFKESRGLPLPCLCWNQSCFSFSLLSRIPWVTIFIVTLYFLAWYICSQAQRQEEVESRPEGCTINGIATL